jgi:hypothetical protein
VDVVYEQPAKFNRHVDESIPLTWRYRWRTFKLILPICFFCYVTMAGALAARTWVSEGLGLDRVVLILLYSTSIVAGLCLAVEVSLRMHHRTKRVLRLKEKRVSFQPSKWPPAL